MRTIRTSTTRQGKAVAVVMATLLGLQSTAMAGQTTPAAASPRQPPPYRTLTSILADIQDSDNLYAVREDPITKEGFFDNDAK